MGEYHVGNLTRFDANGQALPSQLDGQPYGNETFPLPGGEYAGFGVDRVSVRRYDGTFRWVKSMAGINLFYRLTVFDSHIYLYGKANNGTYIVQKLNLNGDLIWQRAVTPVIHPDLILQGDSNGLFLISEVPSGFSIQRLDPTTGTVTASVVWNNPSTRDYRFAVQDGRVAVIQMKFVNGIPGVEINTFDGRSSVSGTMPLVQTYFPPDPYPTGVALQSFALCSTEGGFIYSYVDGKDTATITKQLVGEIDLEGNGIWSTTTDGPNEHEMPCIQALFADRFFVYGTGSVRSRDSSYPYDRFTLAILRREDGQPVGGVQQGYNTPRLRGSHILVDDQGTIAIGLDHGTLATQGFVMRTYLQSPRAKTDRYRVREGGPFQLNGSLGVLANDIYAQGATASVTTAPSHGSLALAADGSFLYTPAAGFRGIDSARYEVRRGNFATNASVNFVVYRYVSGFTLDKSTLQGADQANATVTFSSADNVSDSIRISDNSSLLMTPPSASIPANSAVANFSVQSLPVTVPAVRTVTIYYQGESRTVNVNLIP